MTVSGTVSGTSRADLENKAREIAKTYYELRDSRCVSVWLRRETSESEELHGDGVVTAAHTTFTAEFECGEEHKSNQATYGFPKCMYCNKELKA